MVAQQLLACFTAIQQNYKCLLGGYLAVLGVSCSAVGVEGAWGQQVGVGGGRGLLAA